MQNPPPPPKRAKTLEQLRSEGMIVARYYGHTIYLDKDGKWRWTITDKLVEE